MTAASEGLGLTAMASDFGMEIRSNIHVDATAAIGIAERKGLGKVRHLDTQALWIQDAAGRTRVTVQTVDGERGPADPMTKAMGGQADDRLMGKPGVG